MPILAQQSDNPPSVEQDTCPTHRTPGTRLDRITTVHVPTCGLYRRGDNVTREYVPGTLDALLDEQFGPVAAPQLLAEQFGGTR